jgi:hypothetical protein
MIIRFGDDRHVQILYRTNVRLNARGADRTGGWRGAAGGDTGGPVRVDLVSKGDSMRRSTTIVTALAALVVGGALAIPAGVAGAVAPTTLYVSPTADIHINNNHHNCATAGYNSVQAAINAAPDSTKIVVCRGTYHQSVVVSASKHDLNIEGNTGSVIEPSTPAATVADEEGGYPIVAIVRVAPGAIGTDISGIKINGAAIQSSVNGCGTDLAGLLWQATSGHSASGDANTLDVVNTTPTNAGCGSGLGIDVEDGTGGTASVTLHQNAVSGYGKNGITCGGIGVTCAVSDNTITSAPTAAVAQNGVQIGFGAHGSVTGNFINSNVWTAYGSDTNPEVQSDFASGVLLYGAGLNSSGKTTDSTSVASNFLKGNQIGVEVVDSKAVVQFNDITETAPGIADSIGIFGVGCDAYCMYFTDHPGGAELNTVASTAQTISVHSNTINFASTPSGSYGVWLGDNSWTGNASFSGPAGKEVPTVTDNNITNVGTPLTIAGGA